MREGRTMVLLRHQIGDVLRDARQGQGRTLREVSKQARVSLGYLSEIERGQKEASSELLASICGALEVPLSSVLHTVSQRVAEAEGVTTCVTMPDQRGVADHLGVSEQLSVPGELSVSAVTVPDTVPDELTKEVAQSGLVSAA